MLRALKRLATCRMKANLDAPARSANSQFAKIADRLDRVERAADRAGDKLAHIAEAVDRLDKNSAAPMDHRRSSRRHDRAE